MAIHNGFENILHEYIWKHKHGPLRKLNSEIRRHYFHPLLLILVPALFVQVEAMQDPVESCKWNPNFTVLYCGL